MPTEGVVHKLALEVRYGRGIVYLDRCGSLMLALQDALGEPFRGSVPQMSHGELRSDLERIVVHYGPQSFGTTQVGPETAARFEKVASTGWRVTADHLEVGRCVERCGMRCIYMWPCADAEAARAALARSGLVQPAQTWIDMFGGSDYGTVAAVKRTPLGGHIRVSLDCVTHQVEGLLPRGHEVYVPPAAIQLDVDYVHDNPDSRKVYALGHAQLKEFIRASWQDFKAKRDKVESAIVKVRGDDG
jgi:hypothetical protein